MWTWICIFIQAIFDDDDDEDEDDEGDGDKEAQETELMRQLALKRASLASNASATILQSLPPTLPVSAIDVHAVHLSISSDPVVLPVFLNIDGVDTQMLNNTNDMNDFLEKLSDDLSSVLGHGFERFTMLKVSQVLSVPDRVVVSLNINPSASSDIASTDPERIFQELVSFVDQHGDQKNQELLTAFITSVVHA